MTAEYAPEPIAEWCVRLTPREPLTIAGAKVLSAKLHASGVSHTLYGRKVADGLWTYAVAAGVDGPFDQVAVALPFFDFTKEAVPATIFQGALDALRAVGIDGEIATDSSPEAAAERSAALASLVPQLDVHPELQLVPSAPLDRARLHEALTSRGLLPTDGPMYEPCGRDDSYAVEVYDDLLRFYLSVPRTARPVDRFDEMVAMLLELHEAFPRCELATDGARSVEQIRVVVADVARRLSEAGLEPGAPGTLLLF